MTQRETVRDTFIKQFEALKDGERELVAGNEAAGPARAQRQRLATEVLRRRVGRRAGRRIGGLARRGTGLGVVGERGRAGIALVLGVGEAE